MASTVFIGGRFGNLKNSFLTTAAQKGERREAEGEGRRGSPNENPAYATAINTLFSVVNFNCCF